MPRSLWTEKVQRLVTQWAPISLTFAAVGLYFCFLYLGALNIPFGDDITDVLKVMSGVVASEDAASAFKVLFAQHNDHRTIASRLLYYGTYLATGEISFRTLTFLASSALPLLLLALFLAIKADRLRYLILLPAALILLQLRFYGIALWSMAALAYFFVFLYGFYSLGLLHRVNLQRFLLSVILAILATFTLASGQVIWLVGLASLTHQWVVRKSASPLYAMAWLILAGITLTAWRYGLETPNTLFAMLSNLAQFPGHHILYTLTLLGSAVSPNSVAVAASAGAIMLISVITSTVVSYKKADLRLELFCWFVILSVVAMVLGRSFTTVEYGLSSRYSFPSVLMLATTWTLIAVRINLKSAGVLALIILASSAYCITSYRVYGQALQPHVEKRVNMFNRGNYWAWPSPMKETNAIVAEAISLGIYIPPQRPVQIPWIFNDQIQRSNQ